MAATKALRKSSTAVTAAASKTISKTGSRGSSKNNVSKQADPIGTASVTCSALNVRNGAGTSYPRIGGLSKGKTIQVYEDTGEWLKIAYGTGFGYVSQKYTTFKDQAEPSTEPETPVTEPETPVTEPEPETPTNPDMPESADSTAPAGATYTGTETTKKGSSNKEAVKTLQLYLNKYLQSMGVADLTVDGSFGNGTWTNLMYYQYSRNLCDSSGRIEVDGICGPKTWAAIRSGAPIVYDIRQPIAFSDGKKLEEDCTKRLSIGGAMCPKAAEWFEKLLVKAHSENKYPTASSTFRAMTKAGTTNGVGAEKKGQIELYVDWNANTTYAAKPGYSNHQSGKAIDVGNIGDSSSDLFKWFDKNAGAFSFSNYIKEAWHWNYVGK